jgi:hypothetical protein
MKNFIIQLLTILGLTILLSCNKDNNEEIQFTIYEANGDIVAKLNEFKSSIGNLNTTPNAVGGRREINWDGIADSLLDKTLPQNFFNTVGNGVPATRQRGLMYGDGEFQVSATNFSHINNEAATEFAAFTGNKVFANTTALDWPVGFQVAGEATTASVKAFGMVFADVDKEGSVSLEFFEGDKSIGKFFVLFHNTTSKFSFLGLSFQNRVITKVKVHHEGRLADGQKDISQGGAKDLIVIDDLIYSEPVKRQ